MNRMLAAMLFCGIAAAGLSGCYVVSPYAYPAYVPTYPAPSPPPYRPPYVHIPGGTRATAAGRPGDGSSAVQRDSELRAGRLGLFAGTREELPDGDGGGPP